jgi:sigma54-dependent transcription regulator
MSIPETVIPSSQITATITAAARAMYPHDALPDDVYARVAGKLAEASHEDPGAARVIEDGVSALSRGRAFAELSEDEQLVLLNAIEGSEFFELVRSTAVVEVYSDQRTWKLIGYEGPSFDKGGYIRRGFDDLDWLPDPDAAS